MSSHNTHHESLTDYYDDDSNRNGPRPSAERGEALDQNTASSQIINSERPSPDAYRQPRPDIPTPPEKPRSLLKEIWDKPITKVGLAIGAVVTTAAIVLGNTGANEASHDPTQHENDRATVDTQPQDENTIEEPPQAPSPSESTAETSAPTAEEDVEPTSETGMVSLEGINSKEAMTQAVVEFMSDHMMAGATQANFEAWEASGEDVDTFSTNLAHEKRLAIEAAHPGLGVISISYLDQAELLNATALKQFFLSTKENVRPFHAEFVYMGAEDVDDIDRGPILGTSVTVTLEINGMTVVDTTDKPLEYRFKTNAAAVDTEGATIWDIENNAKDGSLIIGNINADSLPETSTLTRGA